MLAFLIPRIASALGIHSDTDREEYKKFVQEFRAQLQAYPLARFFEGKWENLGTTIHDDGMSKKYFKLMLLIRYRV
jgi:hypothetical protein